MKSTISIKSPKFSSLQNAASRKSVHASEKAPTTGIFAPQSLNAENKIPAPLRNTFEKNMQADFSNVKIQTNSTEAKNMHAKAFARGGNEIHFASGHFNLQTQKGKELLGHELAHIVQQRQGNVKTTAFKNGYAVNKDAHLEHQAKTLGKKALQHHKSIDD